MGEIFFFCQWGTKGEKFFFGRSEKISQKLFRIMKKSVLNQFQGKKFSGQNFFVFSAHLPTYICVYIGKEEMCCATLIYNEMWMNNHHKKIANVFSFILGFVFFFCYPHNFLYTHEKVQWNPIDYIFDFLFFFYFFICLIMDFLCSTQMVSYLRTTTTNMK